MSQVIRRSQKTEIATIRNNHQLLNGYGYGGNHRITPKDKVLIDHGHFRAYDVLRDVMRDPHTFAVLQKRWLSVVERELEVAPGGDRAIDKKAADLVKRQLEAIASYGQEIDQGELVPNIYGGFDQVCYNLLKAEHFGFSPAEIIWGTDGKEVYPKQVKDKSPGRFAYLAGDKGYRFRLLTPTEPWTGIRLPGRKFIIHTFHPEDDNPYGWGMGGRLFNPVLFKRRLAEFALTYAERFGSPTGKGGYPTGREDLKDSMLEALGNIAQESNIVLPEGCTFEWMALQGSSTDIYTGLMDYFDREISKTVLGETGSTDQQGSGGSRARDQVGNEVRIELTKASSDFLSATLNRTLIPWMTWYNFGDKAKPPKVWRKFPELEEKEDLNGRAQRDNTLSTMMELKPTREYIEETYSIILEEKSEDEQEEDELSNQLGSIFGQSGEGEQPEEEAVDLSESFNFKASKQIIKWQGLDIGVEYEPGDRRFKKLLKSGYGHIRGYVGADKEALDAYLHPNLLGKNSSSSKKLYQVTQLDKDGGFDEHKYMLGYSSKNAARKAYLAEMPKSFFGSIKKVTLSNLDQYRKPVKTIGDRFAAQATKSVGAEVAKWRSQINDEVQRIGQLPLDDATKFSRLQESLYSLYSEMDVDEYGDVLAEAIAAAEFAGRYEVIQKK